LQGVVIVIFLLSLDYTLPLVDTWTAY
jgi:hypothetical protein